MITYLMASAIMTASLPAADIAKIEECKNQIVYVHWFENGKYNTGDSDYVDMSQSQNLDWLKGQMKSHRYEIWKDCEVAIYYEVRV